MTSRPTALERAFALASSGACASTNEIRLALKREGYSPDQLFGRSLIRQLAALCAASRRPDDDAGSASAS
ncbi:hypothetical protein Q0812_06990 [Brevundimonas sp. 2R-24]|uniref:Regulatory protein RecX n=1 Tax=Peiella sedimenti TaxID=3061083 RepID=A0ABT8SKT5_9CAUL|nr:hypothetical protein [Caulobacteraceae bacterium XZ-24]